MFREWCIDRPVVCGKVDRTSVCKMVNRPGGRRIAYKRKTQNDGTRSGTEKRGKNKRYTQHNTERKWAVSIQYFEAATYRREYMGRCDIEECSPTELQILDESWN